MRIAGDADVLAALLSCGLQSHVPAGTTREIAVRREHDTFLVLDGRGQGARVPASDVLGEVLTRACQALVVGYDGETFIALHGGAVSREETGVVLCGPSGCGKSTLSAFAIKTGWTYLSEEVTLIDSKATISPLMRPIGMRRETALLFPHADPREHGVPALFVSDDWLVNPAWLSPLRSTHRLTASAIVFPRWSPEVETSCAELGPADAILHLAQNSSSLTDVPRPLQVLSAIVNHAPCYELIYGDADEALEVLSEVSARSR